MQVKYLGEDGENTPLAGAVALCSPWDLLVSILLEKSHQCSFYISSVTHTFKL